MARELTTMTSKGQLTIPSNVRNSLALSGGDRFRCFVEDDHIVVVPVKKSIKDLKGMLPKPSKAVSIDDMNEAIRRAATQEGRSNDRS